MVFQHSMLISATKEQIFSIYRKVDEWPVWDKELESISLTNGFTVGSTGRLKPKGGPESPIRLTHVTDNQSFTFECSMPLCKMHFVQILKDVNGSSTEVINELRFSGLLAPLFRLLIGKSISKTMPDSLAGLKQYAEAKHSLPV